MRVIEYYKFYMTKSCIISIKKGISFNSSGDEFPMLQRLRRVGEWGVRLGSLVGGSPINVVAMKEKGH